MNAKLVYGEFEQFNLIMTKYAPDKEPRMELFGL